MQIKKDSEISKLLKNDVIIFFSIETTQDKESFKPNYRKLVTDQILDQTLEGLRDQNPAQNSNDHGATIMIKDLDFFIQDKFFPNIVQIDWQVKISLHNYIRKTYDVKFKQILATETHVIKPTNMQKLKIETITKTGLSDQIIEEKGISFQEAITKFTQFAYENLILKNQSFELVVFGDWMLKYQFPIEAAQKNIKLGPHFNQYISLMTLISEVYGHQKAAMINIPEDLVTEFNIQVDNLDLVLKASYHCLLIAEFFQKSLLPHYTTQQNDTVEQDLDICYSPTDIYEGKTSKNKQTNAIQEEEEKTTTQNGNGKVDTTKRSENNNGDKNEPQERRPRSRSRSIENRRGSRQTMGDENEVDSVFSFIKIINVPDQCNEIDLFKLIPRHIKVYEVKFGKDRVGLHSCVFQIEKFSTEEVINLGIRRIKDYDVETFVSSKKEFSEIHDNRRNMHRNSDRFSNQDRQPNIDLSQFNMNEYLGLKLRGLPFQIRQQDIEFFFKEFELIKESVKIGRNFDGQRTGEAAVLFQSESESKRAFQVKQGQNIAHRWIQLYQMTVSDYAAFDQKYCCQILNLMFSQQTRKTVKLNKYITEQNMNRVMKLRGLPYSITCEEICQFFREYDVTLSDVVIEEMNGKKTGYGLVFFKDSTTAQDAKLLKNKQQIGKRYVEVLEVTPQDLMQ
ncbi:UNKNOWN [Stylonychia lemnae]|uniref:RRM domain-containing protein n=1 Tax=Stylonychia lemnae TaxID=5949 RepID=A0A077ZVT3_STYLE|nr:UNKNOWN [Stylonychia lemnae]|eukprot:CDW73355.1 UNKNOWN [Stylonychia lemnae]